MNFFAKGRPTVSRSAIKLRPGRAGGRWCAQTAVSNRAERKIYRRGVQVHGQLNMVDTRRSAPCFAFSFVYRRKWGRGRKKQGGKKEEERNKNILIIATALHGKNSTFPRIRPFKSNCKCPSPFQFLIFLSANNYRYVKVFLLTLLSLSFFYSLYIVFLSLLSANTRLSFFFASPSLLSLFNNFPRACSLDC